MTRLFMMLAVAVTLGPLTACNPDRSGAGDATLFTGARLILGDGRVVEQGALLVRGDSIIAVGPVGEVDTPPGSAIVELSDKTIIPALIDAHAHLGYQGDTGWGADQYSPSNLAANLNRYAYYGFGAVFSAGTDPDDLALALQADQASGAVEGARFLFAGGMGPPGQGPNDLFLEQVRTLEDRTGTTVLRGAATPEEGRAAVREIAGKGIPIVKIWVDDRGGSQVKLSPQVYGAIIDEAHALGLEVFVHQQSAQDMPGLVEAGVDGFLHGRIGPALDADVARLVADADAFLIPNLGLGERRRARSAEEDRALREGLERLQAAGVHIVLGTDAGAVPEYRFGETGHRELEIFVRLGMTPMEALVAGTSRAAEALGLDDVGFLAPGKRADFVILDANPLDDIANTRSIDRVYLRGMEIDREALRASWPGMS